ncbi:MAG: hypothetical protein ACO1NX_05180 [Chitinophagaceae bacterium]
MQLFTRPVFIVCSLLFLLHQLLQKVFKVSIPFADACLDNFLVMPILLTLWLAEKKWLFGAAINYQLSKTEIAFATFYVLLVTEGLFPLLSPRFTFDGWDIAVTVAGSFIYFLTQRTSTLQPSPQKA